MEQIIDYKVAVLLAEHGEKTVVRALARKLGLSVQELEQKLQELNNAKPRMPATRRYVDSSHEIESILAENPDKADNLKVLFQNFQERAFLPELKDVRRFFDQHSFGVESVKSRSEVAMRLFRLLATLDNNELKTLCEADRTNGFSSLGIISDQIMRRSN